MQMQPLATFQPCNIAIKSSHARFSCVIDGLPKNQFCTQAKEKEKLTISSSLVFSSCYEYVKKHKFLKLTSLAVLSACKRLEWFSVEVLKTYMHLYVTSTLFYREGVKELSTGRCYGKVSSTAHLEAKRFSHWQTSQQACPLWRGQRLNTVIEEVKCGSTR